MSEFAGLTLEELKKLRCVVVRDDVPVPGCLCVRTGDDGRGKDFGDRRWGGSLDGYGEGYMFGDWDDQRGLKGDQGDKGGRGGGGGGWGGWGSRGSRASWGGRGSKGSGGFGDSEEEGEGGGAGYRGEYDYLRFFLEPCEKLLSSVSTSSGISCIEPELQRSIAIVKPDAVVFKEAILRAIFEAGFQIVGKRVLHLTPEQVSEIYSKHYGTPSFPHLVVSVSAGPVLVLSIAALNAVSKWKKMIGPDGSVRADWFFPISMRKRYGLEKTMANMLHASENLTEANKENRYFYPDSILEPLLSKSDQVADYCDLYVNPTLLAGLTEVLKKKPTDPVLFLAEWLLNNNPFQPRFPKRIALSPT